MAFFYYDIRVPTDEFKPRSFSVDELDALLMNPGVRDSCVDYHAEFKSCVAVQHQTKGLAKWKSSVRDHCGYYFDHWHHCRERQAAEVGLSTRMNGI